MTDEEDSRRSIKNWAVEDRPREKMMQRGEQALTDAELLAILIGSGTQKQSAVELMQDVLERCGGRLSSLSRMTINELMAFNGIGMAKAVTLKAAAEIGRRRALEKATDVEQIKNAEDIFQLMLPQMRDLGHEEFWALFLNHSARVIKKVRISSGGITQTAVDVRMVLKEAILAEATNMVVCHNHPSGSLRPSKDDENLTKRLVEASAQVSIKLVDHVIITDGQYYSFLEHGKI